MAKFNIQLQINMVINESYHDSIESLKNAIDVGSRCWEGDLIGQLQQETEDGDEKGVCHCYRSRIIVQGLHQADDLPLGLPID